jgi:hypothetical protein
MSPQAAVPKPTTPPALAVQLVDPEWTPISTATVTVTPSPGKGKSLEDQTDYYGYVKFWIAADGEYTIEAKTTGFKTKRLKHVYLSRKGHDGDYPAYIQLRLKSQAILVTAH